ncbi:MAG TPA: malto-oligosyltrehalose synthase [Dongiaceae bacterium]|nr:malto-oligosyltrehalose synthase [Dongiaceae bacterium]
MSTTKVVPRATMRLQLNKDFTFDQARAVVPYLAKLGISHVYASPILAARPGSMHSYDTVDPTRINPELGGREGLRRFSEELRRHDMGLIVDIVPNHMAATAENPWWWDVLLHGRSSRYATFFDIDWEDPDPELHGKLLLPVLGDRLDACIARGEIKLDRERGAPILRYFDQRFPIDPATIAGSEALPHLLQRQHYRLSHWREAAWRIDWRRFFDINQLVALCVDREAVFAPCHGLILDLVRAGVIDGVRVDHVDGLAAPIAYCRHLREALRAAGDGRDPYLVVEKILASDERLSADWPVDGTTGYDFMDRVAALLHDPRGEAALTALWQETSGDTRDFDEVAKDARHEILLRLFPKQLDRLMAIARVASGAEIEPAAMVALLAAMRRYRLYGDARGFDQADTEALAAAIERARQAGVQQDALEAIRGAIPHAAVRQRFGQLSATLAAKAVEDTAFYRYHRLISRNEVGGDPGLLAIPVEDFHADAAHRRERFPAAMLATATHDQKRGEDVRARLAVLSEMAEEWAGQARRWLAALPPPDPKVGLMILQTVIGAWPLEQDGMATYQERLSAWLVKALREGKQQTSWERPDEGFERSALDYLAQLLQAAGSELGRFADRIAAAGAINGLAQTLLRLTVPGVPDLYQGTEFWDLSLVDPDNRRPVDFEARTNAMQADRSIDALLPDWRDGRIKQALIAKLLDARRRQPRLFSEGSYEPVAVAGPRAEHIVAFLRRVDDAALLVLAPRWMAQPLLGAKAPSVPAAFWEGTTITLPEGLRGQGGRNLPERRAQKNDVVGVEGLLSPLPIAAIELS